MESTQAALLRFVNEDLLGGTGGAAGSDDEIVLDGTVDSLGVARLIGFMESEFDVAVPAEDVTIENFRSITTMAAYLHQRVESKAAS